MDAADGLNKISLNFLEKKNRSSHYGDWVEYNFVLDCDMTSYTISCITARLQEIIDFLKKLSDLKIGSVGFQEVKCDEPRHLYFGIYVIKDVGNIRNIPEYNMTKEIINLIENDEI